MENLSLHIETDVAVMLRIHESCEVLRQWRMLPFLVEQLQSVVFSDEFFENFASLFQIRKSLEQFRFVTFRNIECRIELDRFHVIQQCSFMLSQLRTCVAKIVVRFCTQSG